MFSQAFERGSYRLHVGRRDSVKDDHIIKVGRHLCQGFDDFVNHFDEPDVPAGRSSASLGHGDPLVDARRSVKLAGRGTVSLRTVIGWNKETKSKRKNNRSFLTESRT